MKIKDLPKNKSLDGVVFFHPQTKERCIWRSQWQKGVWFKKDIDSSQIYPLIVEKLEDALEFDLYDM